MIWPSKPQNANIFTSAVDVYQVIFKVFRGQLRYILYVKSGFIHVHPPVSI